MTVRLGAVRWLLAILVGCGGDDALQPMGGVGEQCYPNGTCNDGLMCVAATCTPVELVDAGVDDAMVDAASADAFVCPADPLEPNQSSIAPTATPIDGSALTATYAAAVCPKGDRDTFSLEITEGGRNIEFIFDSPYASLGQVLLLNAGAIAIALAPTTSTTRKRGYAPAVPVGSYYVQVRGATATAVVDSYQLTINVTGP